MLPQMHAGAVARQPRCSLSNSLLYENHADAPWAWAPRREHNRSASPDSNTSTVRSMLHDRAKVHVQGGAGGNGVISFRREAHVPRGGPDGGDGGRGGDVVLVCDASRRELASLRFSPHVRAGRGRHGEGARKHGARGEDEAVPVPPGTTVDALERERYDLVEPGQRAIVATGGGGGHGNKRFANSTRQAPRFAESGVDGQSGWIELQLRLIADAGLVGLPNAGKSSLIGRLTRAAPK